VELPSALVHPSVELQDGSGMGQPAAVGGGDSDTDKVLPLGGPGHAGSLLEAVRATAGSKGGGGIMRFLRDESRHLVRGHDPESITDPVAAGEDAQGLYQSRRKGAAAGQRAGPLGAADLLQVLREATNGVSTDASHQVSKGAKSGAVSRRTKVSRPWITLVSITAAAAHSSHDISAGAPSIQLTYEGYSDRKAGLLVPKPLHMTSVVPDLVRDSFHATVSSSDRRK